jgi:hypothetical protein
MFKERRRASCRLESVESAEFRSAMYEENRREAVAKRPRREVVRVEDPEDACFLCGVPGVEFMGIWIVRPQCVVEFGWPSGTSLLVTYRCCESCARQFPTGSRGIRDRFREWLAARGPKETS